MLISSRQNDFRQHLHFHLCLIVDDNVNENLVVLCVFCFSFSSLAPKHHIVLLFSLLSTENARHKSGIEKKWLAFCSNRLFFSSASDMHTKMEFWKHQFYFLVSWLRQLNPEKYNCPTILYTGIRTWYLSILVSHRAILYAFGEKWQSSDVLV